MCLSRSSNGLAWRANVNTIPDEILLKILEFVPYPGTTVIEKSTTIKQHDSLRLVSSRFNIVLSDNAFKTQLARCQFNDLMQLYDVKNIKSTTELRNIAIHSANADALVERLVRNDTDNIRSLLRLGVLVLEYLKSANTYSTNKDWMTLIIWANDTTFSSNFRQILRFTIARIHDTFVTDPRDPIAIPSPHSLSSVKIEDSVAKSAVDTMFAMFKYRAFETAFLLTSQPLSLLAADGPELRHMLRQARAEHSLLAGWFEFYAMNVQFPEEVRFVLGAAQQAADMEYMSGCQWRLLSPQVERSLDCKHSADVALTAVMNAAVTELRIRTEHGESDHMSVANVELLNTFDKLDLDLKAVGTFLRRAGSKVKREDSGIPEHVVKQAQEVEFLRAITDHGVVGEFENEEFSEEDQDDESDGSQEGRQDSEDDSNEGGVEEDVEESDDEDM